MPIKEIHDIEAGDGWEYNSVTERRLHVGSLIERLGSFVPAKRLGYDMSRTENSIMKRNARHLYNKRIGLARNIAYSKYERKDEILNSALLSIGMAPNSADGWKDYVFLLSEREGGWSIFLRKLRDDVERVRYYQRSIIMRWAQTAIYMIFTLLFPLFLSQSFPQWFATGLQIILLIGGVAMSVFAVLHSRSTSEAIRSLVGSSTKDTDGFVSAEKARSLL